MNHQSIIRNNNHFIKLGKQWHKFYRDQWFLIDGPWFDYLEDRKSTHVTLGPYVKMQEIPQEDGECREFRSRPGIDPVVWERVWVPYMITSKKFYPRDYDEAYALFEHYEKYGNHVTFNPVDCYLFKKSHFLAWSCNGGELPAWIRNKDWDEHLDELFMLLYHYQTGDYVSHPI